MQQPAPAGAVRPVVRLTLDDAVKFALERNLDIAVQRLNPQINDIAIASVAIGLPPVPHLDVVQAVDDNAVDLDDFGHQPAR